MDVVYISALSALAGSVIGGLTSGVTTWLNQRSLARAGQLAHELSRRQELYKDFIVAASKAYAEALVVNEPKIEELIALYAMISRMRAMSSSNIIACAERVLLKTTDAYFEPNRTVPELRELIKTGTGVDPLKDFAEAAREERRQSLMSRAASIGHHARADCFRSLGHLHREPSRVRHCSDPGLPQAGRGRRAARQPLAARAFWRIGRLEWGRSRGCRGLRNRAGGRAPSDDRGRRATSVARSGCAPLLTRSAGQAWAMYRHKAQRRSARSTLSSAILAERELPRN